MSISSQNSVSGIRPVAAAQPFAKRVESREVTFGAGVPTTNTGDLAVPPANDGHTRLDAFSKRIESRFEHAIQSQNLTPRQSAALQQERDRFQSLLSRFEAAYLGGAEGPRADAADGIQRLLANFSKSVNHILGGGESDETPIQPNDPSTVQSSGRGSVDLIG
jgi:hypothetical protein